jgi:hypothetical protein
MCRLGPSVGWVYNNYNNYNQNSNVGSQLLPIDTFF